MNRDQIIKQLRDMAKHPTVTLPRDCDALRAAADLLAQPEQEPVAWGVFHFGGKRDRKLYSHCDTKEQAIAYIADRHRSDDTNTFRAAPIYTTPPQRTWVGLTDEEIQKMRHLIDWTAGWSYNTFARAVEAKLKEKNGC